MLFPIIWILIGVILLGIYNGFLLKDDKTPEDDPKNKEIETEWHVVGAIIFCYITATACLFWGIQYVLFSLSLFWTLYAGLVHMIGLKKPFFYVGTTASTDKLIRSIFPKKPELGSALTKTIVLLLSILLILWQN